MVAGNEAAEKQWRTSQGDVLNPPGGNGSAASSMPAMERPMQEFIRVRGKQGRRINMTMCPGICECGDEAGMAASLNKLGVAKRLIEFKNSFGALQG